MRCLPALVLTLALGTACHRSSSGHRAPAPVVTSLDDLDTEISDATEASQTVMLELHRGSVDAEPGKPNAVAFVPKGYDHDQQQVHVVVYLHGWWNCVENVLRPQNGSCGEGRPMRRAHGLAGQLQASGKNVILLVPELAYDQPSSNPGRFTRPGEFVAFVDEALHALHSKIGHVSISDVGKVIVVAHSGGWSSASEILAHGGLWVDEVWLFDALYGPLDRFEHWLDDEANQPGFADGTRRFVVVYTDDTAPNSMELKDHVAGGALASSLGASVVFQATTQSHDDVPRTYFERLLASSALPDRPDRKTTITQR